MEQLIGWFMVFSGLALGALISLLVRKHMDDDRGF
jgi:hypothetical protein